MIACPSTEWSFSPPKKSLNVWLTITWDIPTEKHKKSSSCLQKCHFVVGIFFLMSGKESRKAKLLKNVEGWSGESNLLINSNSVYVFIYFALLGFGFDYWIGGCCKMLRLNSRKPTFWSFEVLLNMKNLKRGFFLAQKEEIFSIFHFTNWEKKV